MRGFIVGKKDGIHDGSPDCPKVGLCEGSTAGFNERRLDGLGDDK